MSETETMDRLLSGEWVVGQRGLERVQMVPQNLEVVVRADGARVLVLHTNGQEQHRLVLPRDAALHLAELLAAPAPAKVA